MRDLKHCLSIQEEEELQKLKEYNKYLNPEGLKRLTGLWSKKDTLDKLRKKNGL